MNQPGESSPVRMFYYRHERRFLTAWVALLALGFALLVLPPLRDRVFWRVERLLRDREAAWVHAVDTGERLLAEGRLDEAEAFLLDLDRRFPARTARGRRDTDRERLLHALARTYEAQGRPNRALLAYQALQAYDPRNYRNSHALGAAWERLEGTWTIPVEARDAFVQVLEIHPTHLPSLRGALRYDFDRGAFAEVITRWESSLDAQQYLPIPVRVGGTETWRVVPVDGAWHEVGLTGRLPDSTSFRLATAGFPLEVREVRVDLPLRAGVPGSVTTRASTAAPAVAEPGVPGTELEVALPAGASEGVRLRFQVRVRRPVDQETWTMVETSYRNRLDPEGVRRAADRVVVVPDQTVADRIEVPS